MVYEAPRISIQSQSNPKLYTPFRHFIICMLAANSLRCLWIHLLRRRSIPLRETSWILFHFVCDKSLKHPLPMLLEFSFGSSSNRTSIRNTLRCIGILYPSRCRCRCRCRYHSHCLRYPQFWAPLLSFSSLLSSLGPSKYENQHRKVRLEANINSL